MPSDLTTYLQHLQTNLHLAPEIEADVLRELRTHAEDRVAELEAGGLSRTQAVERLLRDLDRPRVLARQYQQAHQAAAWTDAAIAAAAFLLAAALYGLHLWGHPVAVATVAAIIVGVTLYGLWQGRPAWFYPWAGLALTLLSFCGYLAFVLLERAANAVAPSEGGILPLAGVAGAALYFPLALVVLASCVRAASRRDWLDASLMLSPSAPVIVWLAVLHQNGGIGATVDGADSALAATFLSMAVAATVFVRAQTRSARVWTMLLTGTLVLFATSFVYEANGSLSQLVGRAVLLFAFLGAPAALDAAAVLPLQRPADEPRA